MHKRSVVSTLLRRAKELCSDARFQLEEEKCVRLALKKNGYPKRFIDHSTPAMITSNVDVKKEEKPTATVTIPYVQGIAESIRRLLEKVDVKVRMRPYRTLRQILVRLKDPVPAEEKQEWFTEFLVETAHRHTLDKQAEH